MQTLLLGFCWDMLSQLAVFHDCVFHCCVTSGTIVLLILNVIHRAVSFQVLLVTTCSDSRCRLNMFSGDAEDARRDASSPSLDLDSLQIRQQMYAAQIRDDSVKDVAIMSKRGASFRRGSGSAKGDASEGGAKAPAETEVAGAVVVVCV